MYKIGLIPEKYSTNKDTPFRITITASGGGHIEKAKMMVYSDEQVKIKIDEDGNYEWSNVHIAIDPEVFKEDFNRKRHYNTLPLKSEFTEKIRTIQIKSKFTGDHSIFFLLSYTPDSENWYVDRLVFKFHVNSFLDNNQSWLAILAILIAIISLIIAAVAPYFANSG